jgi:hypothetical protein
MAETFDEQLSRFDLMCEGDSTWDLSENDLAALLAVRTEMRIMARVNISSGERIAALERKLASLDWTPITPENLPTKDDEVLGLGSVFLFEDAYDPNEPPPTAEAWIRQGYTHRRPLSLPNPPSEHPAPDTGEE